MIDPEFPEWILALSGVLFFFLFLFLIQPVWLRLLAPLRRSWAALLSALPRPRLLSHCRRCRSRRFLGLRAPPPPPDFVCSVSVFVTGAACMGATSAMTFLA